MIVFLSSVGKVNSCKFAKCFQSTNLENAIEYEMYGIPWKCFQENPFFLHHVCSQNTVLD